MRIFSRFDWFYFIFSRIFILVMFTLIFKSTLKIRNIIILIKRFKNFIEDLILSSKSEGSSKVFRPISFVLFFYILILNLTSVLSFNFAFTSQLRLVIWTSLIFWTTFIIFNLTKNMKGFISHCIPEGSPAALVVFLFLIEIISIVIRPLTLTVRLVANILAGHLLLILLSKLSLTSLFFSLPYIGLNTVEIFVALIQSYIITTILCLYYNESC